MEENQPQQKEKPPEGFDAVLQEEVRRLKEESSKKAKELQDTRAALLNMLEDTEGARRQADENRRRTELVIEDLSDGLMVFNGKMCLDVINPQASRMFGIDGALIVNLDIKAMGKVPVLGDLMGIVQKERDKVFRRELKIREKTFVEITTALFQPGKEAPGLLVTLHDITREREIERMKTEFVSLAAHQLRTPLSGIKWTLQMFLDGDFGTITEQQKEMLEKSTESNERMIHLINDLLNVTRIEEGRYLYQPVFKEVGPIVESMVLAYQDEAIHRGVTLTLDSLPQGVPLILIDEEKIRLAIQNLIENGLRYTPKGGSLTVWIKCDTKEVLVFVKDTGIGIPESEKKHLFEKFFRATNAKKVDTEGSGLGLYLVKNIVEAHGGKLSFESKEGEGSTFTFTIPLKRVV